MMGPPAPRCMFLTEVTSMGRGSVEIFRGRGGPALPFLPGAGRGGACIPGFQSALELYVAAHTAVLMKMQPFASEIKMSPMLNHGAIEMARAFIFSKPT